MFKKLFGLFGKEESKTEAPTISMAEVNKTPSKGIQRGSLIGVSHDQSELYADSMVFGIGEKNKTVVGVSRHSEQGESRLRAYTNDDYFLEINYFGEDEAGTDSTCVLFQLVPEQGEDVLDEQGIEKWKSIIEDASEFELNGHTYTREDKTVFGGLEIVEVGINDIKPLDQTYAVFSRKVSASLEEMLIINAECNVVIDEDTGEVVECGDVGIWVAVGIELDSSEVKAYNK